MTALWFRSTIAPIEALDDDSDHDACFVTHPLVWSAWYGVDDISAVIWRDAFGPEVERGQGQWLCDRRGGSRKESRARGEVKGQEIDALYGPAAQLVPCNAERPKAQGTNVATGGDDL